MPIHTVRHAVGQLMATADAIEGLITGASPQKTRELMLLAGGVREAAALMRSDSRESELLQLTTAALGGLASAGVEPEDAGALAARYARAALKAHRDNVATYGHLNPPAAPDVEP